MFKLPFISRKKHEAELEALRQSISKICNTGCQAARCTGKKNDKDIKKVPKRHVGHTHVHPGKRVKVTMYDGTHFVAKFKDIAGKFHLFHDHGRVKSSSIRQLSILTTDYKDD